MSSNFDDATCMICKNKNMLYVSKPRDSSEHQIVKCEKCGHVQLTPLPTIEQDDKFYRSSILRDNNLMPEQEKDDLRTMEKYGRTSDIQVNLLTRRIPLTSSILEIGSGYGWLVEKMTQLGYHITGIELNPKKCDMARIRSGVVLHAFNFLTQPAQDEFFHRFNIVCMFQLLEHFRDPIYALKQASKFLLPGGQIFVEVPNYHDFVKSVSKDYDDFSYMREHLSYFTLNALRNVLELAGYANIQIKGIQYFSVENAIHWIRHGIPYLEELQFYLPESMEWIDAYYKQKLEEQLKSNNLFATATFNG